MPGFVTTPRARTPAGARGRPIPDEGHGWRKQANRITSTVAITRFFVNYLK